MERLCQKQKGARLTVRGKTVWREQNTLYFGPELPPVRETILTAGQEVLTPFGNIRLTLLSAPPADLKTDADRAYIDMDKCSDPLRITPGLPGDRLRPFGMAGTKKLSDLLIDNGMAAHCKRAVPIVRCGDEIIWVAGVRMAEPFRVTTHTKLVGLLELKRS